MQQSTDGRTWVALSGYNKHMTHLAGMCCIK